MTLNRPFVHVSKLLKNFLCPWFNFLNGIIKCFTHFFLSSHLETENPFKRQVSIFFNNSGTFPVIISQKLKETLLRLLSSIFVPFFVLEVADTDSVNWLTSRKTLAYLRFYLTHTAHYKNFILSLNDTGDNIDCLGPMYAFSNSTLPCYKC